MTLVIPFTIFFYGLYSCFKKSNFPIFLNIWRAAVCDSKYRISFNKRPQCLLYFETVRCGAY